MSICLKDGEIRVMQDGFTMESFSNEEIHFLLIEMVNHCDHIGMMDMGERLTTLASAFDEIGGFER